MGTLQQYKDNLPKATTSGNTSNNFNRPPVTPSTGNTDMQGWRNGNSAINVFGQAPFVDWNTNYTNWDLNSSSSSSLNKFAEGLSAVTSIFSLATAGITTAVGVTNAIKALKGTDSDTGFSRKESKQIAANTENASAVLSSLNSTLQTADSLPENASVDTVRTTTENLMNNVTVARDAQRSAQAKSSTADANVRNLKTQIADFSNLRDKCATENASYSRELNRLKSISNPSDADKAMIEKYENLIKNNEKQIKKYEDQIAEKEAQKTVQLEIKSQNDNLAVQLEQDITSANSKINELNRRVNQLEQ